MFQFAVDAGLRADNPFADVRNRDRQRPRDRVLSMEELRAVWEAAGDLGYPWGPWYRLILLTGDRRGEWARARWDWLDCGPDAARDPRFRVQDRQAAGGAPQRAGAGYPRRASPRWRRARSCSRATAGRGRCPASARPRRGWTGLIAHRLGHPLPPWVVHDLRRSMATHMERIGVEPHVIEVCLGHVLKGVAGTYRQYGYLPEKAAALQRWADELMAASGDGVTEARRAPAGVGTATQASAADAA